MTDDQPTGPVLEKRSIDEVVGRNIRELRDEADLTQRELADRLRALGWQIDTTALTRIESGTRSLRVSQLELFAKALECSVDVLMDDETMRIANIRTEFNQQIRAARHYLVEALKSAEQVANRTQGEQGAALLADSGLRDKRHGGEYLDYLRERVAEWVASSNADPRVGTLDIEDIPARLRALADALTADLLEVYSKNDEGEWTATTPERAERPSSGLSWMLG